jgi:hypothetical protein
MRGAKVTEKLALATSVLALSSLSCASDHRVSPWGGGGPPPLLAFVTPPDLEAELRAVDRDAAALGLRLEVELRGALRRGGGAVVVRGYAGTDAVGRRTTAVRVATPRGVVMAVGPLAAGDLDRSRATELVPSLIPGAEVRASPGGDPAGGLAFASGTDLNGDGDPDVALRSESGALEIWAIRQAGSAPYPVELEAPPTLALDVDADGRIDLAGRASPRGAHAAAIAPDFIDVATFEGDRYTDRSAAARAFHAERAAAAAEPAKRAGPGGKTEPGGAAAAAGAPDDAARLRRALERAWHARLAGEPRAAVLAALDREPAPAELRAELAIHRQRVAAAGGATAPTPTGSASGTPAGR